MTFQVNRRGAHIIMKDYIYIISIFLIRLLLKIIPHGKINERQAIFISYLGKQYSCNPKYISQALLDRDPDFSVIWAFEDPEKFQYLNEANITIVKYNSFQFIRKCLTSKYIITNTRDLAHIPLSSSQILINTWHGGGAYKTVGTAVSTLPKSENYRQYIFQKTNIVFISSSKAFTDLTIKSSFHHKGKILECGMPRNDILINKNMDSINQKVRSLLQIPADHKILIYAPTYRKNKLPNSYSFDTRAVKKALSEKFGGNWEILFRMHYYIIKQLSHDHNDFIDASDYPDMQELLYASDALITDYSSSIWDFSFTKRPCFLYATDLSAYDLKHGFYTDIHTWPFPLAESNKELVQNILQFDEQQYFNAVKQHHLQLGSFERGTASAQIVDYILNPSIQK